MGTILNGWEDGTQLLLYHWQISRLRQCCDDYEKPKLLSNDMQGLLNHKDWLFMQSDVYFIAKLIFVVASKFLTRRKSLNDNNVMPNYFWLPPASLLSFPRKYKNRSVPNKSQ